MIAINYKIQKKYISEFKSVGHAEYAKGDELDIVCACASSIIIGGLNNISDIKNYVINIKKGNVKVIVKKPNDSDNIVLKTIIVQLKTLEKQFKKNLKVKKE